MPLQSAAVIAKWWMKGMQDVCNRAGLDTMCLLLHQYQTRRPTLKVGSSFWNLLRAFEKPPEASRVFGMMARLMTGSGIFMEVIVYLQRYPHHPTAISKRTIMSQGTQCE